MDDAKPPVLYRFPHRYRSRIHVKRHQPSVISQLAQYQAAVAATAKSTIHINSARLYRQSFHCLIR
jgi:hypothetical protein